MREDIWVDNLNFQSYQNNEIDFIDDSGKSCCVHSLTERLAEERMKVCNELKNKIFAKTKLNKENLTVDDFWKMVDDCQVRGE